MTALSTRRPPMRVYPLDPRSLTQEQIAVTFAMTSRNAAPFDEIVTAVTEAKAADFHEKWVLNYGHASVAEHAVIHMAVENISRLACDELEDNRLASFTEKSSRYQLLDKGSYHVPIEIRGHPSEDEYVRTCDHLFEVYHILVERTIAYLKSQNPQRADERDSAYNLRLRRIATDHCRFVLPASTLTNVGVTMNARTMEHAITKLLSSALGESVEIGELLKAEGQAVTPTLIKYADRSEYLTSRRQQQRPSSGDVAGGGQGPSSISVSLAHFDSEAEEKLVSTILYGSSGESYGTLIGKARRMSPEDRRAVVDRALSGLGPFDPPIRELESIDYTFDMSMDYGAFREYRRHRIQTTVPQLLTISNGYVVPPLVDEAACGDLFGQAMAASGDTYRRLAAEVSPKIAQYATTHAHLVRVLAKMNLRECYHLLKLRSAAQAHFTIRDVAEQALALLREVHPLLISYIQLRE